MKYFSKKIVLMAGIIIGFTACGRQIQSPEYSVDTAMGTIVKQTVYASDKAGEIMDGVRQEIVSLEEDWLSKRKETSAIYKINEQAGLKEGTEIEEYLLKIMEKIYQVSEDSEGALDITIGETVQLWNIDEYAAEDCSPEGDGEQFQVPEQAAIVNALSRAGYRKVRLEDGRIYIPEGTSLDLGAVGKGIACDKVLEFLKEQPDVRGAVISIGGSILTYGQKPDGSAWRVGIVAPRDTSSYMGSLVLKGEWCVSTSGDYERYVEKDGVRYHHIIDPATGYPADAGLISVTVLSKDGCLSDALSTACFVLGAEKAVELLEKYGAYGVLVEEDGNIILTPGMENYFVVTVQPAISVLN